MTDFKTKTMTKKTTTMTKNKILAGVTTVVALSGFVPAINAASPTANTNVGAEVVIQQAITINVGAPVNFGTVILSNTTVAGTVAFFPSGVALTFNLAGEASLAGGHAAGSMAINSSAGQVNIAVGANPTDNGGAIEYVALYFGGTAITGLIGLGSASGSAKLTENVNLVGGVFDLSGAVTFNSKPTPGIYNSKSWTVTVTDI